ncbi:hypothetical protein QAD02_015248 [Eretmocerus hayati]|uniref:Uncharacterized protein n=1 Tax=Eretmocerus hayati TaxID=131215 RepID=A0ACC2P7P0_9HYME|nr:hypothetical protein QAD02_015248 [Eretmocerus hayati]
MDAMPRTPATPVHLSNCSPPPSSPQEQLAPELMDLGCESPCMLDVLPRTPATPAHLINRNRESFLGDEASANSSAQVLQYAAEIVERDDASERDDAAHAPLRMRIRRINQQPPADIASQ